MVYWLLLASFLSLLISALVGWESLLAVSSVSAIVALVALSSVPRLLLISFWLWMNAVLMFLILGPEMDLVAGEVLGLPVSAFCMLVGVWLAPVLLWPLGFYLKFREWPKR